jgi:hypothetical protein
VLDSTERVLYTCGDVVATRSASRSESSRGWRNKQSGCVVGDIESTGGRAGVVAERFRRGENVSS